MSTATRAAAVLALTLSGLAACTAGQLDALPRTSTPPSVTPAVQAPAVPPPGEQLYPVDSVYDGDTLRVLLPSGASAAVRVLGIDAPEMASSPRSPETAPEDLGRFPECGAVDARDDARALLQGKSVSLTADPAQGDKDVYGRLLRYVQVDGRDLAESLLHDGWVQVYTEYPVSRTPHYLNVQANALAAESGGWAMCGWSR